MTDKTIETTLFAAERLNNSVNGNPRYRLITSSGSYQTQSDAACSYVVDNIARRIPNDGFGLAVTLTTTKAGRVWKIEVATNPKKEALKRTIHDLLDLDIAALPTPTYNLMVADIYAQIDRL